MIYLDNAATTFPKPESVYQAVEYANRNLSFNAGRGSYKLAREATKLIDETKGKLLSLVDAPGSAKVVFTPSITIAINEILNGLSLVPGDNIYVSPYEHNAVARTVHLLCKKKNVQVIEIPLDRETLEIDVERLKYLFSKKIPACVCCTHVSNVTGYILPVEQIFRLAKQYSAVTVLDTAQSMGVVEVNAKKIGADFIAFAGHKTLYGPMGIGGFIDVNGIKLNGFIVGGTGSDSLNLEMPEKSPEKHESSSQNIVAIAGLRAALDEVHVKEFYEDEKRLTEYLIQELQKIDDVTLYLPPENVRVGMVSLNVEGYKAEDIGLILDEDYDIAVRTGYHCAPFVHKWLKDEDYAGTVRVSVGRFVRTEDIDSVVRAIGEIVGEI